MQTEVKARSGETTYSTGSEILRSHCREGGPVIESEKGHDGIGESDALMRIAH
jgi:hypothetical protein